MMMPSPPLWPARAHSSMPWIRYGRQVQISEPNTSEPLHSSCTRQVILVVWSGSLLEELPAPVFLWRFEALRQAGQIPDRVDRNFDHGDTAVLVHDFAVQLEPAGLDRGLQFGQIEAGARDGNARTDVDTLGDLA